MRSKAMRRHEFLKRAAAGLRRFKEKGWSPEEPNRMRDRFRKKWCGCWMCARVRESEGPTVQERRWCQEVDDV